MGETKKGFYYGWVVVLAAFLCHFVTTGLLIYTFSLFVVPMSELLNAPRTSIAIASSIYTVCVAVLSPVVGSQIAKGRVKVLILAGAVFFAGGFFLLSFANSLPLFYVFYTLVGIGTAFAGPVVSSALPTVWFDKRRGLAVGIANCGGGIAAIFVPSIVANISAAAGVQTAFMVIAAIAAILLVAAALLVKSKPQDIGLMPDGLTQEEFDALPKAQRPVAVGLTRSQALKTPAFWLVSLGLAALGFGQLGVMQNAAAFLTDLQFDAAIAATALGAIGVTSTVSKIFFGWLADRIDAKIAFCIGNVLLLVGTLFLTYTQPDSGLAWLLGYALIFGFGIGSWASTVPLIVGNLMGVAYFGAIWGITFAFRTVGDIAGVPGISAIAGAAGYQTAFWIAIALFIVSALCMLVSKKPQAYADLEKEANA